MYNNDYEKSEQEYWDSHTFTVEEFKESNARHDQWLLENATYEELNQSELTKSAFVVKKVIELTGLNVDYLKDDGYTYLLTEINCDSDDELTEKVMILSYFFKNDVIRYETVEKLKNKMDTYGINNGIIVSNRPAFDDARKLAQRERIYLVHAHDFIALNRRLLLFMFQFRAWLENDLYLYSRSNPHWYKIVDYDYLYRLFKLMGYNGKIYNVRNKEGEIIGNFIEASKKENKYSNIIVIIDLDDTNRNSIIIEDLMNTEYYFEKAVILTNKIYENKEIKVAHENDINIVFTYKSANIIDDLMKIIFGIFYYV